ncbi:ABC-2 type transport system permease protein [Georgenia satyanarayanai]|uniref:ABC-2 type transport system permease protein n=1 Tax=Georgenia satyanarayanai TaxID=860221 RepID=A0A2Y8ZZ08_9MICO|nr:ABC transporter permease [Georgenia satyanarayanai]PYG01728.1 ABC-2 type transport system permease protein [Georgenia satyanarayanai]SSA36528.1 ABC-2 type transport system permease protein [Georgenia satyanarayanai]
MRAPLAIAGTELRRFTRDRSNIFFALIFPLLLVVVIGLQFGGGGPSGRVALTGSGGELSAALAAELTDAGGTVTETGPEDMRERVARGRVDIGLLVDDAAEEAFAAGAPAQVELISSSDAGSPAAVQLVRTALQTLSVDRTQLTALIDAGVPEAEAGTALAASREAVAPVELRAVDVDEIAQELGGLGQFDLGAATMVLLFVFLSTLGSAVTLIQSRRLGVQGRVLAAPVSGAQAILGQLLGRWVIASFQGLYIMVASALLFDVDFGSVGLALLIVLVFGAVATGAAMLLGSLMDHEGAANGVAVGLGLVLAALGGCMFPLELMPDTLRTVAHATPHAWGYEAFAEIQRHDGGLADIAPQLGVLAAMAVVLVLLGAWALRRSVARAM